MTGKANVNSVWALLVSCLNHNFLLNVVVCSAALWAFYGKTAFFFFFFEASPGILFDILSSLLIVKVGKKAPKNVLDSHVALLHCIWIISELGRKINRLLNFPPTILTVCQVTASLNSCDWHHWLNKKNFFFVLVSSILTASSLAGKILYPLCITVD